MECINFRGINRCLFVGFLLMGTVSNSIIKNEKLYNSMLSYTEGSEAIYDVELVKSDIKSLSNSEIDEVMSRSNLAYPLKERVYENIMTEAFKAEGITTLGDYFNESIVRRDNKYCCIYYCLFGCARFIHICDLLAGLRIYFPAASQS